jgi:hypothetical protein
MDLFWIGLVVVLALLTFALIGLCDHSEERP